MSRYIYQGSFIAPAGGCEFEDGRDRCDAALKKLFARGPQRPDTLQKRLRSDADVAAELAMPLSKQQRRLRSNAHEALEAIKNIHGAGPRRTLPESIGEAPFASKSIAAVRKAHGRALHVNGRMLSARELNKAFASTPAHPSVSARDLEGIVGNELQKRDPGAVWRSMSQEERHAGAVRASKIPSARWNAMTRHEQLREMTKGLTTARPRLNDRGVTDDYNRGAPESSNSTWNDVHANTGAGDDWHDQITPTVKPTRVTFPQFGVPGQSRRDDAVEAIREALTKPKRLGASPNVDDSFTRER
jgi:hypothetical protein